MSPWTGEAATAAIALEIAVATVDAASTATTSACDGTLTGAPALPLPRLPLLARGDTPIALGDAPEAFGCTANADPALAPAPAPAAGSTLNAATEVSTVGGPSAVPAVATAGPVGTADAGALDTGRAMGDSTGV